MDDAIVFGFLAALSLAAAVFQVVYQLPRHWDGRLREKEENAWAFLPYSDEFKSGLKRIVPVAAIGVYFFVLASISAFGTSMTGAEEPTGIFALLLWLSVVPLVTFIPLAYLVVYHNRPKFLIAPHYRDEKGVVQIRRSQGRLGRSRIRTLVEVIIWLAVAAGIAALIVLLNPRP
ncbi:MAG TPA: hypothetical protein H9881_02615 [Candidatus Stackebrandtia excrementipullorum]|nr:hypothetical protein [Candidatus Stackebrandtia excrementipullorum]